MIRWQFSPTADKPTYKACNGRMVADVVEIVKHDDEVFLNLFKQLVHDNSDKRFDVFPGLVQPLQSRV